MEELTREDWREFKEDLKTHMDEKFEAHEEREALMMTPITEKIEEHDLILRGQSGRGGLIKDVNMFQWVSGGAMTTAIGIWIKELMK